jgi:hypothetical protein
VGPEPTCKRCNDVSFCQQSHSHMFSGREQLVAPAFHCQMSHFQLYLKIMKKYLGHMLCCVCNKKVACINRCRGWDYASISKKILCCALCICKVSSFFFFPQVTKKTNDMWIVMEYYSLWSFLFSTGHIWSFFWTKFCMCTRYNINHFHDFISHFWKFKSATSNNGVWTQLLAEYSHLSLVF